MSSVVWWIDTDFRFPAGYTAIIKARIIIVATHQSLTYIDTVTNALNCFRFYYLSINIIMLFCIYIALSQ